jgi:hypothetical protein
MGGEKGLQNNAFYLNLSQHLTGRSLETKGMLFLHDISSQTVQHLINFEDGERKFVHSYKLHFLHGVSHPNIDHLVFFF